MSRVLAIAPFVGWALYKTAAHELRWDHVALALLAVVLACQTDRKQRLFWGALPLGFVALLYDAMCLVRGVGLREPGSVHLCDLRAVELRYFGTTGADGVRITLHDWLQAHAMLWLDVLCAIPYGTFLFVVMGYALFLFFRDFGAAQRFAWCFFAVNVAGFVTYHLFPAAPPWYFHQHGCVVDLAAHASAGPNLTRVDALLGVPYFKSAYGRATDVFGAVPSLHVAYPLLIAIQGFRQHGMRGRTLLIGFYLWMCFSAVYLDHHWVIDVLVGSSYAAIVAAVAFALGRAREPAPSRPSERQLALLGGR